MLLKSRIIAEKVVDALGPGVILGREAPPDEMLSKKDDSPAENSVSCPVPEERYQAIAVLMKSLEVEAVRKSNVILVTYDGPSPQLAQAVVNRVIRFHLDRQLSLARSPEAQKFLGEQTELLRSKLEASEEKLRTSRTRPVWSQSRHNNVCWRSASAGWKRIYFRPRPLSKPPRLS